MLEKQSFLEKHANLREIDGFMLMVIIAFLVVYVIFIVDLVSVIIISFYFFLLLPMCGGEALEVYFS